MVNSSLAVTGAGVFVAVKSTLDPGGAVNDGAFRPIELRAPPASVVDVRSDAPAGAHGEVRKRAVSVALGALSQIIPERCSGDLCGTSFPNSIGGYNHRRERQYVYYEAPAGGNGGFAGGGRLERLRQRRLRQHPHHPDGGIDRERDAAHGGAL